MVFGSGSNEHKAARRLFALALDENDRREIEAAQATLLPIPGDSGDEYRRPPFLTASGDLSHHLEALPPAYAVKTGPDGRSLVLSGTEWERIAGFCRAVRRGDRVWISGTTATHRDLPAGGSDVAAQLHFVVDKIEGALQSLGGRLEDVVRTRVFVRHASDWEAAARAHGERFGAILSRQHSRPGGAGGGRVPRGDGSGSGGPSSPWRFFGARAAPPAVRVCFEDRWRPAALGVTMRSLREESA